MQGCSDGTWQGVRYFCCPPKRGFFSTLSSFMSCKRITPNRECYIHNYVACHLKESVYYGKIWGGF